MAADYAALEARVTELERQMRHVLPAKIDAVAYGLSLVHDDLRAFRGEMSAFREETQATLDRHGAMLEDHGRMLGEILRRLPGEPGHDRAGNVSS
jgi:hypothetical protein